MLSEKPDLGVHFPAPPMKQWADLVEKIMKGRSVESMTVKSDEGIPIRPLYTSDSDSLDPQWPDSPPYTRGSGVLDRRQAGWDICQLYDLADIEFVRARIEQDLTRGINSVWLKINDGESHGLVVKDLAALKSLLSAIDLKAVPVVLDGGRHGWPLFSSLIALAKAQGLEPQELSGAVLFDPLSELLRHGSLAGPSIALDDLSHAIKLRPSHCPELKLLSVSSLAVHNAGASGAQELGWILASLVYYLRALEERSLAPEDIVPTIRVSVGLGRDMFCEIAKVRALRTLWSRVLDLCGLPTKLQSAHIHGVCSGTTQSRRDPWVNMLRSTSEAFAGTVAGVDTLTVLPFDRSLGAPSSLGYRMSGNLQLLLAEEAHLGRVADPAGGSWFIEELTKELCETAWSFFQSIEAKGGAVKALATGFMEEELAKVVASRRKDISRRKAAVVGVSEFPENSELLERPLPAALTETAVDDLSNFAATLDKASESRLAATFHCLDADASYQSLFQSRRSGDVVSMRPLPGFRWANDWEELRTCSDRVLTETGRRPHVFLAKIGELRNHKARAAFAERFFLAGGFQVVEDDGFGEAALCLEAYKKHSKGQPMGVILCGSDEDYQEVAADWAKTFASVNPSFIALAGRGGDHQDAWQSAGVSHFIYMGCDGIELLTDLQKRTGA